jgi:hypothetical protein
MSWFYRKFKKSDDDSTVTLTSDYIQLTGAATLTGALTQTGALSVTGNILNTGNLTVTSTARVDTSPIYLGTGTVCVGWGAVDAAKTGVYISGTTNYGIGSLYINTSYGTLWVKTDHASTSWATMYATPST